MNKTMKSLCDWCASPALDHVTKSVYWELPEGTRSIEISDTPTLVCESCGMEYQDEQVVKEIEDQLFLIDRSRLGSLVKYSELMALPRVLKRNYFDFD